MTDKAKDYTVKLNHWEMMVVLASLEQRMERWTNQGKPIVSDIAIAQLESLIKKLDY